MTALGVWAGAVKWTEHPLTGRRLALCTGVFALAGLVFGCILFPPPTEYTLDALRPASALAALAGAAVCDFREKRIPNRFPLTMLLIAGGAGVIDLFFKEGAGIEVLVGSVLGGGVIFLVLLGFRGICHLIIHQGGLGWGDVKLLTALGCLVGFGITFYTLFFGQLAALVISIILLITRKVGIKDGIPFSPFLYIGFYIAMCLEWL